MVKSDGLTVSRTRSSSTSPVVAVKSTTSVTRKEGSVSPSVVGNVKQPKGKKKVVTEELESGEIQDQVAEEQPIQEEDSSLALESESQSETGSDGSESSESQSSSDSGESQSNENPVDYDEEGLDDDEIPSEAGKLAGKRRHYDEPSDDKKDVSEIPSFPPSYSSKESAQYISNKRISVTNKPIPHFNLWRSLIDAPFRYGS